MIKLMETDLQKDRHKLLRVVCCVHRHDSNTSGRTLVKDEIFFDNIFVYVFLVLLKPKIVTTRNQRNIKSKYL